MITICSLREWRTAIRGWLSRHPDDNVQSLEEAFLTSPRVTRGEEKRASLSSWAELNKIKGEPDFFLKNLW